MVRGIKLSSPEIGAGIREISQEANVSGIYQSGKREGEKLLSKDIEREMYKFLFAMK